MEASQIKHLWVSANMLRAGVETDATPRLSPEQVEFHVGSRLGPHEGASLLTT